MINAQQLLSYIERIERLNEQAEIVASDTKMIYNEAKSAGFDPKYIKKCIALRKKDKDEIDEEDELLAMYRNALGI